MQKTRYHNFPMQFLIKNHRKEFLFIAFIVSCIIIVSFYDIFFQNKTFKVATANPQALKSGPFGQEQNHLKYFPVHSTTTSFMEEPIFEFIRNSLKKGIFPFWNPHQACGYPIISMMHLGLFFPLNFILYIFPQIYSWDLIILIRFFLAGFFTYIYCRTLKLDKISSLCSAMIFMLSGPMVLLHYNFVNVDIVTPLILISFEYLIKKPNRFTCCFAALSTALTFFAGHPEHILLVNSLCFIYFLYRLFTLNLHDHKRILKTFLYLMGAYLLAAGLSAMVLFPFIRDWKAEFWHTHPDNMGSVSGGQEFLDEYILSLITPHFFQMEPVKFNFSRQSFWGYIGILPFLLSFLSIFYRGKKRINYFFILAILFIFLKNHTNFILVRWIGYLPLFRVCRFYFHVGHLFSFCIAIAAGLGVRVILKNRSTFKVGLIGSTTFIILLLCYLAYYKTAPHFSLSKHATFWAICLIVLLQFILFIKEKRFLKNKYIGLLILGLIWLELFLYIPRERAQRFDSFPSVPYLEFIKERSSFDRVYGLFWTLYPNTATGYRIDDFGINYGLLLKRYINFINNLVLENHFTKNYGRSAFHVVPVTFMKDVKPLLNMLNVRYSLSHKDIARTFPFAGRPTFPQPIYSNEILIFEHPYVFKRAYIVHQAFFELDEKVLFNKIRTIMPILDKFIILQSPPDNAIINELKQKLLTDGSQATITSYSPNKVVVDATFENPGFLVLSDTYHPDWKAYDNGKETKVFITNYLIRSVFLPQGHHIVQFVFKPVAFYVGIIASCIFLLILLSLLLPIKNKSS